MVTNKKNYDLYNRIVLFTKYSRNYILCSIPKVHNDIKIHYVDELYNLARNVFYITYNKGNIRMKYLIETQVSLSMLDFLLLQIKDLDTIKKNNINNAISLMTDIKNIIYGWKIDEEKKK